MEYADAACHVMARGNKKRDMYGDELDRELRFLLPTDQGVAGSRSATAEPPEERGSRAW